ncbi:MAG TPA: sel1 repeat family protein [Desulfobulbus sp.]|nr:sel1 repeat family protein [Desulfobulbus sp.]
MYIKNRYFKNVDFTPSCVLNRQIRRLPSIFFPDFLCCFVVCSFVVLNFVPSVFAAGGDQFSPLKAQAYRYYNGIGRPVNYAKALRLYLQIARTGDPGAQFVVGGMYYKGQGTDPDHRQGFFWLLKAAEQGVSSPESLSIIGTMYLQGSGVPQNYREAQKYLEQAADLGDVTAKKNLAFMYYNGLTGKPDYGQALELYKEAALLGDDVSQSNVGLMYAEGMGVGVDRVRAYAWYSLAASQGNLAAVAARNNLMIRMNWQELNKAQALSVKLFKEVESNREITDDSLK